MDIKRSFRATSSKKGEKKTIETAHILSIVSNKSNSHIQLPSQYKLRRRKIECKDLLNLRRFRGHNQQPPLTTDLGFATPKRRNQDLKNEYELRRWAHKRILRLLAIEHAQTKQDWMQRLAQSVLVITTTNNRRWPPISVSQLQSGETKIWRTSTS